MQCQCVGIIVACERGGGKTTDGARPLAE